MSKSLDIDFDQVLAEDGAFSLATLLSGPSWHGVVAEMDQVRVDRDGLATYELVLVPRLWLLTQRKNYRVFQYKSELDIVKQLLGEWGVAHRVQCGASHKVRKLRVQYAESDFDFARRMLEDAGISFWFEEADGGTEMVLDDEPQASDAVHARLGFHDEPPPGRDHFATKVQPVRRVRPGRTTIGDLDYRRSSTNQPRLTEAFGLACEQLLEQFDYEPGAFLYEAAAGGMTPTADDRGTARTDETTGARKTKNRLLGHRHDRAEVLFQSDVLTLRPGAIATISDHPHPVVGQAPLLVTRAALRGTHADHWRVDVHAVGTDAPYRPAAVTPKPIVHGLESATVVGGSGDDIHTDEYGRIRVHFHWDRESGRDEASSCWIPTNQPWAGARFGGTVIPRVGQEVLIEFLGGDPDRPVCIARTYTEHQPPPYELPRGKTLTALFGNPTPGILAGGAGGTLDQELFTFQRGGNAAFAQSSEMALRNNALHVVDRNPNANRPNMEFAADIPRSMRTREGYADTRNMLVIGDAADENLVFLQAQRNLHMLVKRGWRTVVGDYRGTAVLGNDDLHVRNKQQVTVGDAQLLKVELDQTIDVTKNRLEQVGEEMGLVVKENASITGKTTIGLKAKLSLVFESEEAIQMRVGSSIIRIDKTAITLSATRIDINPTGAAPPPPQLAEITQQRKAALEAAARAANARRPAPGEVAGLGDAERNNPDLVEAGKAGLTRNFMTGETPQTISGENYGFYRQRLTEGMFTGGRPMTPTQADQVLAGFSGL